MKKIAQLLFVIMLCSLASLGSAQLTTPNGAMSDQVNVKLAKMNLLLKLIPLALQKSQYEDLLEGIEAARDLQKREAETEDKELADLDSLVSDTVTNGVEKGIYPPQSAIKAVADKLAVMEGRQTIMAANMIKAVQAKITKLNAGQRKVMVGSYLDSFVDPKADKSLITDDVKISFFIKNVFLHPYCYDLLVEMSKHAS
ncbi:MAG TPA: hypothetical protein VG944_13385 [Fimbriimonas sp.]|nr:hypothetical protein [Fimbriimonas sp.]